MTKYIVLLIMLLAVTPAVASCLKPDAKDGAIADTVSTIAALGKSGVFESNPLGLVGVTALKMLSLHMAEDYPKEKKQQYDDITGSLWSGAAVNNLFVLFGLPHISVLMGVASAIAFYNMPACEKQDG
jgi:hypothetical protein